MNERYDYDEEFEDQDFEDCIVVTRLDDIFKED